MFQISTLVNGTYRSIGELDAATPISGAVNGGGRSAVSQFEIRGCA